MKLEIPFARAAKEEDLPDGMKEVDPELVRRIYSRILGMTNKDEDEHLPSYRGIELVLLALEQEAI